MLEITVQIRTVYGEDRIYPICDKAKIFASMVKCKTLTNDVVEHIKKLGYEVKVQSAHSSTL